MMPERALNSKNAAEFRQLWKGDWSAYNSQSEADMALCCHLAFWTQKNGRQMDELFRRSGLMRDKWDRQQSGATYGEITINTAINSCREVVSDYRPEPQRDAEFPPLGELSENVMEFPPFPVEDLPKAIGDYVIGVSGHTQTAPDMAATIALGVLAICLQGKYRIEREQRVF